MSLEVACLSAALLWILFLLGERILLDRARRSIRVVVHVNGTRGKSETTRLIAASLRASGIRTLAKTTGTEPRLILPDGSETRLHRAGAPDVREQRGLLLRAAREGAEVLVAECMAVRVAAQDASTAFLAPSILVITNARPDHLLELGDPEATLEVFARGIPGGGRVFTAEPSVASALAAGALAAGASLETTGALEGTRAASADNAGLALAVALACGADRSRAIEAMACHTPDPGASAVRRIASRRGGEVVFVDALAANDVVSTDLILAAFDASLGRQRGEGERLLLISNRADRPDRALAFATWAASGAGARWDRVIVVGPLPSQARRVLRAAFADSDGKGRPLLTRLGGGAVPAALAGLEGGTLVYGVGNWKGLGPALAEVGGGF